MASATAAVTVFLIASAAAAVSCQGEDDDLSLLQFSSVHLLQTSALIPKTGQINTDHPWAEMGVKAAQTHVDELLASSGNSGPGKLANGDRCTPSVPLDFAMMDLSYAQHSNLSLVERYREEGKFNAKGFPKLNYVHIPKTGGDSFQMASAPLGLFGMGQMNVAMAKVPTSSMSMKKCFFEQMPSMDLDQDLAKYVYGGSEIFCAMRDPYARAWSGACHMHHYSQSYTGTVAGEATSEAINSVLQASLAGSLVDRHFASCFWIPQTDFLQGPYGCRHVLDFDDIDSDYKKIVTQFGFGELSLPSAEATHACTVPCAKQNMSASTVALVERIFAKDITYWKEFKQNRSGGQQPR